MLITYNNALKWVHHLKKRKRDKGTLCSEQIDNHSGCEQVSSYSSNFVMAKIIGFLKLIEYRAPFIVLRFNICSLNDTFFNSNAYEYHFP